MFYYKAHDNAYLWLRLISDNILQYNNYHYVAINFKIDYEEAKHKEIIKISKKEYESILRLINII